MLIAAGLSCRHRDVQVNAATTVTQELYTVLQDRCNCPIAEADAVRLD